MNIRPIHLLPGRNPLLASDAPARPWRYRAWSLSLTLSILIPAAIAWFHQVRPAYVLTELGVGDIQAASENAAPSPGDLASVGSPTKPPSPPGAYVSHFTNAAGQVA